MKSSRGAMGVRTQKIVDVLGKAGWQARKGRGDHTVLSKPGQRQIVLADRITLAQWKNIERSVGVEVETLLNKGLRGRGKGLTTEEVSKRVGIAHDLWTAGLPSAFIIKHAGLAAPRFAGFTPKLFEERGLQGVVEQYSAYGVPKQVEVVAEAVEQPIEAPTEVRMVEAQAVDTILDLMQGVVTEVRQIIGQRQARNRNFVSAMRRLTTLRLHIDQECEALLGEMEAAWQDDEEV